MSKPHQRIRVECPSCHAALTVDPGTGLVLNAEEKKQDFSLERAVAAERDKKARADEMFQKAFDDEKARTDQLDKKFREALESKDELPDPHRPFDLD